MSLSDSWTDRQPHFSRVGAAEAVLADLRTSIDRGELPVGAKLPAESALAARYNVSRSVIREALRTTNALGLTATHTGKGTFIIADKANADTLLGHYSIQELREARPHIEVPGAGLAALRRTSEQLDHLWALINAMDVVLEPTEWVRLDGELHLAIAQASSNRVFSAVVAEMRQALTEQSRLLNSVPKRREANGVEHRAIVEAIADGSQTDAAAAMSTHLAIVDSAVNDLIN
jgi:GntR family transcriptional repressor for pyruvate dehydrogenase complex